MSLQETMLSPVESHGRVTGKDELFFKRHTSVCLYVRFVYEEIL